MKNNLQVRSNNMNKITVNALTAALSFAVLFLSHFASAAVIPIVIDDDLTIFVACPDIRGSTNAPGATITLTPGGITVTTDSQGGFLIPCVKPNSSYTLTISKPGSNFIINSQAVTTATTSVSNVLGFDFVEQMQLNFPRLPTPTEITYFNDFQYSANSRRTVYVPGEYFCKINDSGGVLVSNMAQLACRPNLPITKGCFINPFYDPNYPNSTICTPPVWADISVRCDVLRNDAHTCGLNANVCKGLNSGPKVLVSDPIGTAGDSINYLGCSGFRAFPNGAITGKNVIAGEITPDGWAILPTNSAATEWIVAVPIGKRLYFDESNLGAAVGKGPVRGDGIAYNLNNTPIFDNTTLFGGGNGPACFKGSTDCVVLANRAKAQKVNGVWTITITGFMTADSLPQNVNDALLDIEMLSSYGSAPNPTVRAVSEWLVKTGHYKDATLIGHSLGSMDVVTLYSMGLGNAMVTLAPPWEIPDGAMLRVPNFNSPRSASHFCGVNDKICNIPTAICGGQSSTNFCRQSKSVNLQEINTGTQDPHDRDLYQTYIFGEPKF